MKRKICVVVSTILIIASLVAFAYPDISKTENQRKNDEITERFDHVVDDVQDGSREEAEDNGEVDENGYLIDDNGIIISEYPVVYQADIDRLYADSIAYNEHLQEHQDMDHIDFADEALNLADYGIYDGVYGYITASSIGLNAPIYIGASESNMALGAAHLMNTSLPTGGEGNNAALAGHTGYFGTIVFDNIPFLDEGDTVSITTYFGTLTYRVISEKEILSTETNDIYVVKGKNLLTLLTCARMGKTRYQVTCERV